MEKACEEARLGRLPLCLRWRGIGNVCFGLGLLSAKEAKDALFRRLGFRCLGRSFLDCRGSLGRLGRSFLVSRGSLGRLGRSFLVSRGSLGRLGRSFLVSRGRLGRLGRSFLDCRSSLGRLGRSFLGCRGSLGRLGSLSRSLVISRGGLGCRHGLAERRTDFGNLGLNGLGVLR